jgi:hypothetical protein
MNLKKIALASTILISILSNSAHAETGEIYTKIKISRHHPEKIKEPPAYGAPTDAINVPSTTKRAKITKAKVHLFMYYYYINLFLHKRQ